VDLRSTTLTNRARQPAFGIEIELALEPGLAPLQDVAFARETWRAKKQRIVPQPSHPVGIAWHSFSIAISPGRPEAREGLGVAPRKLDCSFARDSFVPPP